MSVGYDKYVQSAGRLAGAVSGIEDNLHQEWANKYQAEAGRENTKKQIDIGKSLYDITQGEGIIMNSVALGTAGLGGVRAVKSAYPKVKKAITESYKRHYGEDLAGDTEEIKTPLGDTTLEHIATQEGGVDVGLGGGEGLVHRGKAGTYAVLEEEQDGVGLSADHPHSLLEDGELEGYVANPEGHGAVEDMGLQPSEADMARTVEEFNAPTGGPRGC